MSEATIDPVYVCPDGNVYRDGDVAPVIKTETGFKYNVPIRRYDCPASDGWRYDYARSQYCAARAKQIHEQTMMGGGA